MTFRISMDRATVLTWAGRVAVALAIVAITLEFVNNRIAILRVNQNPAHPLVLATYPAFHSMATGLREGRIGQVDLLATLRFANLKEPSAPFERLPREAEHQWVSYYSLDVGYSFIVEVARLAFRSLPDSHLRPLALQLVVDAVLVPFVFFVFSHWNRWIGLLAAYMYAANGPFYDLVSFAYYYYWDIPLTFVVLGSIVVAYHRRAEATAWLVLAALALGFGVWLRGSWWPLSLFLCGVVALSPLRRHMAVPMLVFAIVAAPQVIRSSAARGRLTFTTRAVWHVALVGLGYYHPNRYGLEMNDGVIFELTRTKYGVQFRSEDYAVHDEAAKKEFFSIWATDRAFIIRSFFGRLRDSLAGSAHSMVLSYLFVSNLKYRLLCLAGFVAMLIRGADKRILGIAAAGTYTIYVVLTCVFYFVGLAYDNVSEVTLLILFVGGAEAAMHALRRLAERTRLFGGEGSDHVRRLQASA